VDNAKAKAAAATVALARAFAALALAAGAAVLETHSAEVATLANKAAVSGAQTFADAINGAIADENLGFPANDFKGRIQGIVTGSLQNLASAAMTNAPAAVTAVVALARTYSAKLAG
jgi:hypothetical protein